MLKGTSSSFTHATRSSLPCPIFTVTGATVMIPKEEAAAQCCNTKQFDLKKKKKKGQRGRWSWEE